MKKLVVFGWLATAGMTLYDTFREREDGDSIWSGVEQMIEDTPLSKVNKRVAKASIVALVICGAPVFAVMKLIEIVKRVVAMFN